MEVRETNDESKHNHLRSQCNSFGEEVTERVEQLGAILESNNLDGGVEEDQIL